MSAKSILDSLNIQIERKLARLVMRARRILLVCDYFYPYKSGLSHVVKVLAEELVKKDLEVTVLCHQHDKMSPMFEVLNGVNVHRAKTIFRLNRAILSLDFFVKYIQLRRDNDLINLHLPMPEAGLLSKKRGQKLITTYQCDLPKSSYALKVLAFLMDISSRITIARSNRVIFSTLDYMNFSRMHPYASAKSVEIFPFATSPSIAPSLFQNERGRNFGYLGRFTSEKGAIFLIEAFKGGASKDDRLLMAGSTKVAGDSVFNKVKMHSADDPRIVLYPDILEEDLPRFYASLDVFCFPSLNSFEAFGIAQVEALLAGIPVMTSDLPGVRIPVRLTGMGQIIPVENLQEWKTAIEKYDRKSYPEKISEEEERQFSREIAVEKYLKIFEQ